MPRTGQGKGKDHRAEELRPAQATKGLAPSIPQTNYPRTRARVRLEEASSTAALATTARRRSTPLRKTGLSGAEPQQRSVRARAGLAEPTVRISRSKPVRQKQDKPSKAQGIPRQQAKKAKAVRSKKQSKPPAASGKRRSSRIASKTAPAKSRPPSVQRGAISTQHQPVETSEPVKHSIVSHWLQNTKSISPDCLRIDQEFLAASDAESSQNSHSMQSSSTSRITKDGGSTVKAARTTKVSEAKLRKRRVHVNKETEDPLLDHLGVIITEELPKTTLGEIAELAAEARRFLRLIDDHPEYGCSKHIDEFSYNFDQYKSKIHLPAINERHFDMYRSQCHKDNEANLQRTVMMCIFNIVCWSPIFRWNSEGQWNQPKEQRLISRIEDEISLPKPDVAISFDLSVFHETGDFSDAVPEEMESSISPDRGRRCFPFLFVEAKKGRDGLDLAEMANIHSASQALYNIYSWMERAGQEDLFFEKVRVFSVAMNVQDLEVRVHRCIKLPGGHLSYHYFQSHQLHKYTKNSACRLMETILNNYAADELCPMLKDAFLEITSQEDDRVATKRKANGPGAASSKRARNAQVTPDLPDTGVSFSMEQLAT